MMKKTLTTGLTVLTSAFLGGCTGNVGIPDKGRLIEHVQAPASYPQANNLQSLLRPANTQPTGVVVAPQITAYPQQIVDRLLGQWNGAHPSPQIYLVPVEDFTSDVSAGGAIFLNAGLIQYLHDHPEVQSEDALAFVLGHELSHILLGHTVANQNTQEIKNVTTNVMKWGSLLGGKFAGATTSGAQAALASMGSKIAMDTALLPSWTRQQEEAADTLAIDLMNKAGYSVDAAQSILKTLEAEEKRDDARRSASEQTSFHVDNFTMTSKKGDSLDGYVIQQLNIATQKHPHAEAREEANSRYIEREYSDRDVIMLQKKAFSAWINSRQVNAFLKQSLALQSAAKEMAAQNWSGAHKILSSVGAPLNTSQDWIYMSATTDSHIGQSKMAQQLVAKAALRDDVTLPIAEAWGNMLSESGHTTEAETYLSSEETNFGDRTFLAARILNAKRAKNGILLDKLILQCVGSGDDTLQQACSSADK